MVGSCRRIVYDVGTKSTLLDVITTLRLPHALQTYLSAIISVNSCDTTGRSNGGLVKVVSSPDPRAELFEYEVFLSLFGFLINRTYLIVIVNILH